MDHKIYLKKQGILHNSIQFNHKEQHKTLWTRHDFIILHLSSFVCLSSSISAVDGLSKAICKAVLEKVRKMQKCKKTSKCMQSAIEIHLWQHVEEYPLHMARSSWVEYNKTHNMNVDTHYKAVLVGNTCIIMISFLSH